MAAGSCISQQEEAEIVHLSVPQHQEGNLLLLKHLMQFALLSTANSGGQINTWLQTTSSLTGNQRILNSATMDFCYIEDTLLIQWPGNLRENTPRTRRHPKMQTEDQGVWWLGGTAQMDRMVKMCHRCAQ